MIWLLVALAQAPPLEGPILAEIETYDTRILALDEQLAALEGDAGRREEERTAHLRAAAEARTQLDRGRQGVRVLVATYYRLLRAGVTRLVLEAESPGELRRRVRYLEALLRAYDTKVSAWRARIEARAEAEAKAKAEEDALSALRSELQTRRAELQAERQRRLDLVRAIRASAALTSRTTGEIQAARVSFDQSVKVREATLPASAAAQPSADFRSVRGALTWPVRGALLAPFGASQDARTGEIRQNQGLDIAAPAGTPFHAVFRGEVTRAGYVRGYGQVVMLQHGAYTTLYAHANGLRVAAGQVVEAGHLLGFVGTTGVVDGSETARLHFEIRYHGSPQDPTPWLAP